MLLFLNGRLLTVGEHLDGSRSLPLCKFTVELFCTKREKKKNRKKTDATLLIKKAKGCNIIFSDNRQDFSNDGDFKHCLPMGFKLFGHASVYIILTPFCPAQMKRRARGKKPHCSPRRWSALCPRVFFQQPVRV